MKKNSGGLSIIKGILGAKFNNMQTSYSDNTIKKDIIKNDLEVNNEYYTSDIIQDDLWNEDTEENNANYEYYYDEENNYNNEEMQIEFPQNNKTLEYDLDSYFVEAGKYVIERDRAAIGMFQRTFKIGFNRAARIMEQLEEFGIVGKEDGAKPRNVLMDLQQFEILVKDLNYPISNHINTDKDFSTNENQEREIPVSMYMKYFYNIEVDYTEDGERIKKLKNILVPSASNEGQSDFINMLLKYNSPETMKLMLIDYSVINYSIYNGVQHLTVPVLTEEKRITSAFEWLSNEMDSRIQKFLYAFVKNIDAYNSKQENENKTILPRIICIINEATSLPNEIDYLFTKLLLNSNMVGIYFVIFSRFGVKSISLGNKMELLEIMDSRKLMSLLTDNENNKQTIIRKNFDDMNGHEFEYYCAGLLKNNGFYDVEVTQGSGDHGIDILAEKDGITYAIQCKCYSSSIGNAAIQQVHTGKSYYKRDIAVVLTNQYFTQQAVEEAKEIGVKLWDRDKLNEMIK